MNNPIRDILAAFAIGIVLIGIMWGTGSFIAWVQWTDFRVNRLEDKVYQLERSKHLVCVDPQHGGVNE